MIYAKTETGRSALLSRTLMLTPRQRSAFSLCDGRRSTQDVFRVTQGLGSSDDDLDMMVSQGLLVVLPEMMPSTPVTPPKALDLQDGLVHDGLAGVPAANSANVPYAQAQYSKAYPIATRLTAELGLRGFLLNLAVEAASDLDKLQALAPKIRQAVGMRKFGELESALYP